MKKRRGRVFYIRHNERRHRVTVNRYEEEAGVRKTLTIEDLEDPDARAVVAPMLLPDNPEFKVYPPLVRQATMAAYGKAEPWPVPTARTLREGALDGDALRGLRQALGYEVVEMAREVGVSASTWQRWELGYQKPSALGEKMLEALRARVVRVVAEEEEEDNDETTGDA